MSSIIYRTIKGTRYAYLSESYWDHEKKAPRTRRKYLGKVDEETGEIIRVYKKSEKADKADVALESTQSEALSEENERLKEELRQLREQNDSLTQVLMAMKKALDSIP